jgi:hypothetical protein
MFKKRRHSNKEEGQAALEFALVLPLFLLLIFAIIDFGWLFYNYINVENSARNAARIACVEYSDCAVDADGQSEGIKTLTYQDLLDYNDVKGSASYNATFSNDQYNIISDDEYDILNTVIDTVGNVLPESSYSTVSVMVHYTYDDKYNQGTNQDGFDPTSRYKGDVVIEVNCDMKVLTPVLGVTCDNMTKTIHSSSTFKVEKQTNSNG